MWTRDRARAEGVSRRRLTSGAEFVRVGPDAYLEACWADDLLSRAAAVLSVVPSGVLSHWTAVAAHGLPVPPAAAREVHVTVPAGVARPRWPGVVGHRSASLPRYEAGGLQATGAVRSWCDAAALVQTDDRAVLRPSGPGAPADLADLVAAGDALLARRPSTPVDVRNQLSLRPAGRGTAVARRAVALLDPGSESAPESRLRVVLRLAGLPTPTAQQEVRDPGGRVVARVDLAYPAARVAVEYDGDHHRDRGQWRRDLARRERLEALGWRVVVVVAADLLGDPASVARRVAVALSARRAA